MKKILFILLTFILYSCSVSDDSLDTHFEILPVESAILPEEFILGEIHLIELTYLRPSTCHAYNNIFYVADSPNERTVAIVTQVFDSNGNCEEISTEVEASFNFKATELGSYIFKFWQGTIDDEDVYMIVEVPVVE